MQNVNIGGPGTKSGDAGAKKTGAFCYNGMTGQKQQQRGHLQDRSQGHEAHAEEMILQQGKRASGKNQKQQSAVGQFIVVYDAFLMLPQENSQCKHGKAAVESVAAYHVWDIQALRGGETSQGIIHTEQTKSRKVKRAVIHGVFPEIADVNPQNHIAQASGGQVPQLSIPGIILIDQPVHNFSSVRDESLQKDNRTSTGNLGHEYADKHRRHNHNQIKPQQMLQSPGNGFAVGSVIEISADGKKQRHREVCKSDKIPLHFSRKWNVHKHHQNGGYDFKTLH